MVQRLAVFYHVWAPEDGIVWKFLVDEQIKRIVRSGFPTYGDLFCFVSGSQKNQIFDFVEEYDLFKEITLTDEPHQYEGVTLRELHKSCSNGLYDAVGYLHTKGVSYLSKDGPNIQIRAVNTWRHMLEYVVLDHWKGCVRNLKNYDLVGANYCAEPWPHISGNFWWARAEYIKSLIVPELQNFSLENPLNLSGEHRDRLNFEKWVGMGSPKILGLLEQPFVGSEAGRFKRRFNLHIEDVYTLIDKNDDTWRL